MFFERIKDLSNTSFKRLTGVKKATFKVMLDILEAKYAEDHANGGKPSKLPLEDKLLMTLEYWREYRTYFHIGTSYGYSESQAYRAIRWVENSLIKSGKFNLPGNKVLHTLDKEAIVLIDVTESPIERPKKKAKEVLFR
jgi:hypothetical protein